MKTTEYLDELATRYGASDYKIAKMLGVTRSTISGYRCMGRGFDDHVAIKVAELLGLKPEKVILDMHAERSKDDQVRAVWERMAKRVATVTGAVILSAGMMAHPGVGSPVEPTPANPPQGSCILC